MTPSRLILASQSPRRRELMTEAGYEFEVIAPDPSAEDDAASHESPPELVARLARQKAADVARRVEAGIVIGCDTVADCDGEILGKPSDLPHAREMLKMLRGRVHHVYSGLCVWRRPDDRVVTKVAVTKLKMEVILDAELESYLRSGLWQGKSGAFGFQDRQGWLTVLAGSESNVVGLPMELLNELLTEI